MPACLAIRTAVQPDGETKIPRYLHCLAVLALFWTVPALAEPPITLGWPVACEVGKTCQIQHYVDHGGAGDAKDYRCGTVTYKGHDGTDIRVPTMRDEAAGVDVVAAAAGTVLRTRDGVQDISVRTIGLEAVKDHQCGNGLVIAHGQGFETQYCHMAQGSLVVKPGDVVAAGQVLGHVGLSGETEFPHLHITVRHDGQVIDPFAYGEVEGACSGGVSLWAGTLQPSLAYTAGTVLNAGFSTRQITMADIENGSAAEPLSTQSAAVIAFVRSIGLKKGDVQRLVLAGPDGPLASHDDAPLEGNKDQLYTALGRRRPANGWPAGRYTATYSVVRDGHVVIEKLFETSVAP